MKKTGSDNSIGLGYFNMARGIGMVLILLGHSMTPFFPAKDLPESLFSGAGSVLGGGIMAMFFLISGFSFYSRSTRKCFGIQWKLLLKPYCLTAAAIIVTKLFLAVVKQRPFANHGGELVLTYLLGMNAEGGGAILGINVDSVSILWFVLALFGGWIMYNGICRLKSKKLQCFLVSGAVILGWLMTTVSNVWPWCLPIALLAVGYLAAGDLIRRNGWLTGGLPAWSWVLLSAVSLSCFAFGGVNMVACRWKLGLWDVVGSFCVGFLLLRGYRWLMERKWQFAPLEAVGLNSLWIVCLHGYEKMIFPWYRLGYLLPEHPVLCAIFCLALRSIVIFVLMRLVLWMRRKLQKKRVKPGIILQ